MEHIVFIKFKKSKSNRYKKATVLAKMFPHYIKEGDYIIVSVSTIKEFIEVQIEFFELVSIVEKWKGTEIILYGEKCVSSLDFNRFYEKLYNESGKYRVMLQNGKVDVSLGNITYESLPLPIVYYPDSYGAFFAFSEDIEEEIFFCECEREAINNYFELLEHNDNEHIEESLNIGIGYFPPIVIEQLKKQKCNLQACIKYKKNICFRCNKKMPKLKYCLPMYGGQFVQHYGWYVQQEYFKQGTTPSWTIRGDALPEKCDPEIYDNFVRINALNKEYIKTKSDELYRIITSVIKEHSKAIENNVRQQFGYKKIGESWVSETMMFHILERLYPDMTILRHYRPDWLENLELDAFIPEIETGFEYQGIQHFKAVEHWGGEAQLSIQMEHDERKKRLCNERGVKLICIDYDEPLTDEYIKQKIRTI